MIKKIILIIIILPVFLLSCSKDNGGDDLRLYMCDLFNNKVTEFYVGNYYSKDIYWSEDNKYFFLLENKKIKERDVNFIHLFSSNDLKEINIPEEINDTAFPQKGIRWIDKDKLVIYKHINQSKPDVDMIFNVESKTLKIIDEEEYQKYISEIDYKEDMYRARYNIPEDLEKEYKLKMGEDSISSILSYDKSKLIYQTEGFKTYLYNIKTGEKTYLFSGFDIEWSESEKKLRYCLHKSLKLDEMQIQDRYWSKELETYVYDIEKKQSQKIADYYADVYFSPNDRYIVFFDAWGYSRYGDV